MIDALTSAWYGAAGGWLDWGPSDIPHASFQSSFPVLTNESCSFRGSHLGSHPVYWPGATSDFVSVSDQLCQLSVCRGLSLSSSSQPFSVQPPAVGAWCYYHLGLPQRSPGCLSWLDGLASCLPCWELHRPTQCLPYLGPPFPQPVQRVIPLPTPRGRTVTRPVLGRQGNSIWGPVSAAHLRRIWIPGIWGRAAAPTSLIQRADLQSHLSLEPELS